MSGEIVCSSHSVTVLSCAKSISVVHNEKTLRLTPEGGVAPVGSLQSDAQRQAEGRTAGAISAAQRHSKADFTETESSNSQRSPRWSDEQPPPPQLLSTQTHHRSPHEIHLPFGKGLSNASLLANNGGTPQRRGARANVKGKKVTRRKADGKISQNRKVTDFYPIRRSARKSKTELKCEQKKLLDDLITNGIEEGMEVQNVEGKGRAVFATRCFHKGDYVVEYHGDLLQITDAKKREAEYAQNPATGCYMYYFQYLCKTYCVDATKETGRLGRLINHSKNGNCQTKLHDINGVPHLILVAARDIDKGEELLYDYGDRSKASITAHPWLKQ
ncbi:N-lysine methyltransferase KMT5A-A [Cololabis saira]|uniref:N-lysine methyltransferase KMT5A-A n=1 Tax=Cololabis saira TaxID=129043 RepID=UPI002AD3DA65|nr:N-lysine methyltransferase KMT5A-A [Cololabis saira]